MLEVETLVLAIVVSDSSSVPFETPMSAPTEAKYEGWASDVGTIDFDRAGLCRSNHFQNGRKMVCRYHACGAEFLVPDYKRQQATQYILPLSTNSDITISSSSYNHLICNGHCYAAHSSKRRWRELSRCCLRWSEPNGERIFYLCCQTSRPYRLFE